MHPLRTAFIFFALAAFVAGREEAAEEKVPAAAAAAGKVLFQMPLPVDPYPYFVNARVLNTRGSEEDLTFILDTGAEKGITMEKAIAKAFGPPLGAVRVNEDVEGANYKIPRIRLGEIEFPEHEGPGLDLTTMRAALGIPIVGVIGWKNLEGRTLLVDNDHHTLEIRQDKTNLPGATLSLPLEVGGAIGAIPHLMVPMGSKEIPVAIDTGSNSGLDFSEAEYDRLISEGWIKPMKEPGRNASVGGMVKSKRGVFTKGSFLGVDLKGMSTGATAFLQNIVGLEFLLKLNFVITNSPSSFSCSVRKNPEPPIKLSAMTGAYLAFKKPRMLVFSLRPGGPAEKAGLLPGDEIGIIDELGDKPMNVVTLHELCRQYAGKSLTLHVIRQDASAKTIPLQLNPLLSAWEPAAAEVP